MIWWPALMDFCSWVPTQKNVLVWGGVLFVVLLCQWHPAAPTPAITPFRLLSHATGWVGNWRTLFGCVPTWGFAFLFGATDKSNLRELLPYQKKTQKQNFKINSAPGWKMCKAYLKFEVSPLFDACEPCCCKPMAYDNTTFRIPFMLLPYSTW